MSIWTVNRVSIDSELYGYPDVVTMVEVNIFDSDVNKSIVSVFPLSPDSDWLKENYIEYSLVTDSEILVWVYEFLDSDFRVGIDSYLSDTATATGSWWDDR